MSTTFYIDPFDPRAWENPDDLIPKPTSSLHIEPSEYRQKLIERWSEIVFVPGGFLLRWELPPEGNQNIRLWGCLQDNQVVSFGTGPKKSFIDFILWHRAVISEQYLLYLSNSSSWDSSVLTKDTTEQDIVEFTGIIS